MDSQREWALARELAQTKLALYVAQSAYLQLASEKARAELAALGEQWTPTEPQNVGADAPQIPTI